MQILILDQCIGFSALSEFIRLELLVVIDTTKLPESHNYGKDSTIRFISFLDVSRK